MASLRRVDDFVDLERGSEIDCFAPFIHLVDPLFVFSDTFLRVLYCLKLLPVTKFDCTFEPHTTEFCRGPGHGKGGGLEAPTGHGLGSETVAFTNNNGQEGDRDTGADNEEPGGVADQCCLLDLRTDHDPGTIDQGDNGNVESVTELDKTCCLIGTIAVNGTREMHGVVSEDSNWTALDSRESRDDTNSKFWTQLSNRVIICNRVDDFADIIDPQSVLWNSETQLALIVTCPTF